MSATLLAIKAQAVFAVLVTVRHRTVRLALVLSGVVMVSDAIQRRAGSAPAVGTLFVVAGWLAAVAASRLLAPGAALEAAWRSSGRWWLAPAGRLVGLLTLVVPVTWAAAILLATEWGAWAPLLSACAGAALYAAALGAFVLALPPAVGATAAGALGVTLAVFGMVPPSEVARLTDAWPLVQRPVVLLWNWLPLGWRATHWMRYGGAHHVGALLLWIGAGVALASWTTARWYRIDRFGAGGA